MFTFANMSLVNLPFNCFHGSPGTENDFLFLKEKLSQYRFITHSNKSYPTFNYNTYLKAKKSDSIVMGYSWGCRQALEFFFRNSYRVKALILISPYLFHSYKRSLVNQLIKDFPLFRYCLIKLVTKSAINKYLIKTAHPSPIPSNYLENQLTFSKPYIFTRHLLDMAEPQSISYASILREADKFKIPVLVIYGKKDSYIDIQINISMVKKITPQSIINPVCNGGHALLWTHTNDLSVYITEFISSQLKNHSIFYYSSEHALNSFSTIDRILEKV